MKSKLHHDKLLHFYITSLSELGVTHSQLGRKITDLDLEEAHYEYVLSAFREIDAENSEEKWF
ncbi:hypothetical protein J1P26_07320 [Neobacillus sp. MM2021_6]|nr:hypothetical protein [Neobacillus sp. MM2021_6]NHC17160.1 hypothetical protein [Bacillus sp. MM2020_4]